MPIASSTNGAISGRWCSRLRRRDRRRRRRVAQSREREGPSLVDVASFIGRQLEPVLPVGTLRGDVPLEGRLRLLGSQADPASNRRVSSRRADRARDPRTGRRRCSRAEPADDRRRSAPSCLAYTVRMTSGLSARRMRCSVVIGSMRSYKCAVDANTSYGQRWTWMNLASGNRLEQHPQARRIDRIFQHQALPARVQRRHLQQAIWLLALQFGADRRRCPLQQDVLAKRGAATAAETGRGRKTNTASAWRGESRLPAAHQSARPCCPSAGSPARFAPAAASAKLGDQRAVGSIAWYIERYAARDPGDQVVQVGGAAAPMANHEDRRLSIARPANALALANALPQPQRRAAALVASTSSARGA